MEWGLGGTLNGKEEGFEKKLPDFTKLELSLPYPLSFPTIHQFFAASRTIFEESVLARNSARRY